MLPPLKWPEYDQSIPSDVHSGIPTNWHYREFDDTATAPLGDYPRNIPFQWTGLKHPSKYWDVQGRRNYGDLLHDQDNMTDWLGIGAEPASTPHLITLVKVALGLGLMATLISIWDPASHWEAAERDYPFDGLRVELGGDPKDATDNSLRANIYQV